MMTPGETRPATTTFMGDTGLWFVPTGEVLPPKRWSFSLYRVNFDYQEGFTDVSNWPITFGAGLGGKAEIFGAVQAVRRIDRDARPIFFNSQGGGVTNEYPLVRKGWSDNQFGDIVRWTLFAQIEAEEYGITSKNVDEMLKSDNPTIKRILGVTPGMGKALGVDEKWIYNIIKQVGNYGEMFERNVGTGSPLKIARGQNALWAKGGLQYAPPIR